MMRYVLLVFFAACSYGILSTFVKLAYAEGFSIGDTVGTQTLFGLIMMALISYFTGTKSPDTVRAKRLPAKRALLLMVTGTLIGLTGMFYYASLQTLPASIAIILLFQFTWIGVLLDSLFNRKRPARDKVLALIPILIGTFLAGGSLEGGVSDWNLTGVLLGLLSAVSYSLFILFSGRIAVDIPPLRRSTWMLLGSAIFTMCLYPPYFLFNGALLNGLLLWGALLAFFGAVIPTWFFTIGVPRIGGALATILSATELPMAVISAALVLREAVMPIQWTGVVIILFGVAFPELLSWRKKTNPLRD